MGRLTCLIRADRSLSELARRRPSFDFLLSAVPHPTTAARWTRGDRTTRDVQVIFIGKSGYGKSTALNMLIGEPLFTTSDVEACTREMQSVEYAMAAPNTYFSLSDLPGLGENPARDSEYSLMYQAALRQAHVAVYFFRADQRDLSIDLWALETLFDPEGRSKLIIALNAIDKAEPMSRGVPVSLSAGQLANIALRKDLLARELGVDRSAIVPISGACDIGLDGLVREIEIRLDPHLVRPKAMI